MSKMVLVRDMPKSCDECDFGYDFSYCAVPGFGESIVDYVACRHPKCPFKPLPEKQSLTFIEPGQDAITLGWNAAIEAIEGE